MEKVNSLCTPWHKCQILMIASFKAWTSQTFWSTGTALKTVNGHQDSPGPMCTFASDQSYSYM